MKSNNILKFVLVLGTLCGLVFTNACRDKEFYRGPLTSGGEAPGPVSNTSVRNFPGGATIFYQIPSDTNFWYVEASFDRNGKTVEVRSSSYNDSITVNGFGDSTIHEVTLYTVSRSQKKSTPVSVSVHPLTPPVYTVFDSLAVDPTFGGVLVHFKNPDSAAMAITVLTTDSLGQWIVAGDIYHTNQTGGDFSLRGFASEPRQFKIFATDRWGNVSDTLTRTLTPLFETELDKSLFKRVDLPTDYSTPNQGNQVMELAWNGGGASDAGGDFTTLPGHGIPQWFTFDLGVTAKLSRIVVYTRTNSRFLYNSGCVKTWELWGSNSPNPNGDWDSTWTYLMTCNSVKPSGLPVGENSAEDLAAVIAGWNFDFPTDIPPVRYIRWKTLANWGDVTHITIGEMTFYGQVQ
jgi:hypothetical protein